MTTTSKPVSFRLPPKEYEELQIKAETAGMKPGAMVKQIVCESLQAKDDSSLENIQQDLRKLMDSLLTFRKQHAESVKMLAIDAGNIKDDEIETLQSWIKENLSVEDE
jgi:hypothetical protein